jgi:hypothetical protein
MKYIRKGHVLAKEEVEKYSKYVCLWSMLTKTAGSKSGQRSSTSSGVSAKVLDIRQKGVLQSIYARRDPK